MLTAFATHLLQHRLARLLYPAGTGPDDFLHPAGEPALVAADSVSWRVFGNPLSLFLGGVTAVVLQLAEPRVRTGVWTYTSFRERPLERVQRTGYAVMMRAYGARSRATTMIARIDRIHAGVAGLTPDGRPYRASDDALLTWVHATGDYGFLTAYDSFVHPLDGVERSRFYAEGREVARLYGVIEPPADEPALERLFEAMRPQLEPSAIVDEFLAIVRRMPVLPMPLRPLQGVLVRAAVTCVPAWARERLGLDGPDWRLAPWQQALLRAAGRLFDGLAFPAHPAALARRRLAAAPSPATDPTPG